MSLIKPTYSYLLAYYYLQQTTGILGDFNKKFFPEDYKEMIKVVEGRANES